MKRTLTLCGCVAALLAVRSAPSTAALSEASGKLFMVSLTVTESKDGGAARTLAEPTMIVRDGQESSFLQGGETPADPDSKQSLEYGLMARLSVREKQSDKLRVSLYVGDHQLGAVEEGDFNLHQCGTRCVKTVKPGDTFVVDMGEGRQAKVSVSPIAAGR